MVQFPVNLNDATTGHKLQGSSKDKMIIESWMYGCPGWIYTAISRVRKLEGLFITQRLNFRKLKNSYAKTHNELKAFDMRMRSRIPGL